MIREKLRLRGGNEHNMLYVITIWFTKYMLDSTTMAVLAAIVAMRIVAIIISANIIFLIEYILDVR